MLESIAGFHIEPTNICTLKCPQCSRTKFIEKFPNKWKNHQLNLDHLKNFIDIPIQKKFFRLCGDYGDPIYYDNLFDLVFWIKDNNAQLSIHTNGSYKSKEWWEKLTDLLDTTDKIVFGIDGIPDNFTTYRINADWDSIRTGIEVVSKKAYTVWQYIPFKYNINNIAEAKKISRELGIKEFLLLPSSRWESSNDPYRPDDNFIATDDREVKFFNNIRAKSIAPLCKTSNVEHFITSAGFYAPCCHVPNYNFYYTTEFYKNKDKYDISKTTLTEVLTYTSDFYNNLEENKPIYCIYKCPTKL